MMAPTPWGWSGPHADPKTQDMYWTHRGTGQSQFEHPLDSLCRAVAGGLAQHSSHEHAALAGAAALEDEDRLWAEFERVHDVAHDQQARGEVAAAAAAAKLREASAAVKLAKKTKDKKARSHTETP